MKKLNLSKNKVIIICVVLFSIAIIGCGIAYNTPRWNDECELKKSAFTFRGDKYTYVTMYPRAYNFEIDKRIARSGGIFFADDFYTLKNDIDRDFIYVSSFGDKFIYTKANIKAKDLEEFDSPYRKIISPNHNY